MASLKRQISISTYLPFRKRGNNGAGSLRTLIPKPMESSKAIDCLFDSDASVYRALPAGKDG